jgi:hypothetical protein
MEHYFRLKVSSCFWLSTNVIVSGEDPHSLTENGIPKIMRYDLTKLEGTQRTFELPNHIRKWTIEYLSNAKGQDPSHESECVLDLDKYPTASHGYLNLHGIKDINLTVYDENNKQVGVITLN